MNRTYTWWKFLCTIAVVNIGVWLGAIWLHSEMRPLSYAQPILSGIYVLVCAFRSFYPRIDLERYCLFDHPLSSVALGRTSATIAEVCFSIQVALLMFDLGTVLHSPVIMFTAYAIVPIIVIAQACCWYATLSLNHFWHAMEEFAWVVMIVLASGCFLVGFVMLSGVYQILMAIGLLSCLGSAYIMLFIDIPMYLKRQKKSSKKGICYFNISEGMNDALYRRVHTKKWKHWKKEALWITPYFTIGVWLSIGMMLINFHP
jgi:hypothetical protein